MRAAGRVALVLLALAAIDVLARPLLPWPRKSTLFVRDPELGWRLRPSVEDLWDGVPVRVNAKGLRGPEVDYARRPEALRLLYLGDSVTLGYGLADHAWSYPYRAAERLERMVGRPIETVNGAVNGYATWQEVRWFEREGIRYQPDLVVLAFVLNDVMPELEMARSGQGDTNRMLRLSVTTAGDWLANHSSLFAVAIQGGRRARFGRDVRQGAIREDALQVQALVSTPRRADVQRAWAATLRDLDGLAALCRLHNMRLCLVIFPFAFQVAEGHDADDPQRRLTAWAARTGLPALDLLTVLRAQARADSVTPQDYFLDDDHPSFLGSAVVADALADFVIAERLVPGVR